MASDPIEESLEAKSFEADGRAVGATIGQECIVNPDPQIAKQQGHGNEQQSQVRIARAGMNLGLSHLAVTAFDAKPLAIAMADFGGRARHAPGGKQELLLHPLAVLSTFVRAVGDADANGRLPLSV